jgi:isochorismate synthase
VSIILSQDFVSIMEIFKPDTARQLKVHLDEACNRARSLQKEIIFGWQQPMDDLDFLALFSAAENEERFFGEHPDRRQAFFALGRSAQVEAEGITRFHDASLAVRELFYDACLVGYGQEAEERPLLMGGFAFSDHAARSDSHWMRFPASRLVLPELLLTRHESETGVRLRLSLHLAIDGKSSAGALFNRMQRRLAWLKEHLENPPEQKNRDGLETSVSLEPRFSEQHYLQAAEQAIDLIEKGGLEKVVLSRCCDVHQKTPFRASRVLHNLRENYPSCFIFAASMSGVSFLGATPERLLALRGKELLSGPLAGSMRRGTTPEEDLELQKALLGSEKEQHEHAIVTRAIRQALEPYCISLSIPSKPSILELPGIQHLYSEIFGTVHTGKDISILEILGDLHPTPAVGGTPRQKALEWLSKNENLERGWYSGPVGWVNDRGEGDFAIALRAALLRGNRAHLHAGAGIVSGSVPEEELRETELKMKAAFSAILEVGS